jgi:FtsZ-interacting cell division protein ZipA
MQGDIDSIFSILVIVGAVVLLIVIRHIVWSKVRRSGYGDARDANLGNVEKVITYRPDHTVESVAHIQKNEKEKNE